MNDNNFKEFNNNWRLNNPIKYFEKMYGIKLLPYQKILLRILALKGKMSNIRSERYKQAVSVYDIPVQLIRKEDNKILKPLYLNCYNKVYFFTEDDSVIFMKDKALEKYKIEKLEG
ncbi:uncharacterized protein CBO05P1_003 [Clostridium botulinum B str. Osaka05]|uniref:Uncharacterized protein n=1 Tax=Clostridium botulinum B str. Osaka05 TaxID=1407017 RepID=A0A060N4N9_CLOBO|nr:hypothetical protein [Clostridium botulinum]BAO04722.1 uncharacterized protein CBO05P1_003 [Clostridium botulinum B str. Osaka05]